MCTAATYKTKDFYFGRTLDYEFSYGDQIVITPRNYAFNFRHVDDMKNHYAIIGMAHVAEDYPLYYDAMNEKGVAMACLLYTSYGIACSFFFVLFRAFIPVELATEYLAGAVLLGAAPCTAMVFVWSSLTQGNPVYTVVQVATNDIRCV